MITAAPPDSGAAVGHPDPHRRDGGSGARKEEGGACAEAPPSRREGFGVRSGAELAGRLGVSRRTLRRDVERLRELGYPVQAIQGAAGYRLGAGATLPPLLLDDDEAIAVVIGLRTAAGGSVVGIEEASLRALTKLEQVLPARLRYQVNTLHAATVRAGEAPAPKVSPDVLLAVAEACRRHEGLRFDYTDARRGQDRAPRTTQPTPAARPPVHPRPVEDPVTAVNEHHPQRSPIRPKNPRSPPEEPRLRTHPMAWKTAPARVPGGSQAHPANTLIHAHQKPLPPNTPAAAPNPCRLRGGAPPPSRTAVSQRVVRRLRAASSTPPPASRTAAPPPAR